MLRDKLYLRDILDLAVLIQSHLAGQTREAFQADIKTQDAVIRRFEIIGEAANRLSPEAQAAMPEVPWKLVRGMRNILTHDYDDVDLDEVWETAQHDLSGMIEAVGKYLAAAAD